MRAERTWWRRALLVAVVLTGGGLHAEELSVWDGVYTAEQAERGRQVFVSACVACHADQPGQVAGHGPAPSLLGEDFKFRWVDAALADLFDTTRQTMPEAAPNSLSAAEYAALTAYLLQLNGYPAGTVEIDPAQREALLNTYIDESPPAR